MRKNNRKAGFQKKIDSGEPTRLNYMFKKIDTQTLIS